jgi:hypothetical protein
MLTTAITGVITAIAAFFGVKPGPWVAVVWLIVKALVVFGIFGVVAKFFGKKEQPAALAAPGEAPAKQPDQAG